MTHTIPSTTDKFYKATSERFATRAEPGGVGDCWPWTGGHDRDGRGRFWYQGRNWSAPRMALTLCGIDVPVNAMVCHHCDNPACVNPEHLYVGSALTNVRDMLVRGRNRSRIPHPGAAGERNHNAKLSDVDVFSIRSEYTGARGQQTEIARRYSVTPQLVSLIVTGAHRG